ncbi:MAG: FtsX-like permease family protein [bacterium]
MNFPFYIARRYLISKKSHNIINIISAISVVGVAIGTMALIIVLSVFNGFEKLVVSLFSSFNPDLVIQVKEGKTFSDSAVSEQRLRKIPGVLYLTDVIEENALLKYKDKQTIVTVKGVSEEFSRMTGVDTMMSEGKFHLQDGTRDFAILGYGVAGTLGTNLSDFLNPVTVYLPSRTASFSTGMENAFNTGSIFPSGYFSIQQDYDVKYAIMPLRFVKKLLEYEGEITAIELGLAKDADADLIQKEVQAVAGNRFVVKNRYQQQELLFTIMKSEKWVIFLILTFILIIATFNMTGSLSMLILDKKKDIAVLQSLGAGKRLIRRIFLIEGMMISFSGAFSGLFLGAVICWIQQRFGIIKLGSPDSTFVVSSYPVHMQIPDFIYIFITVMAIGFLASWLTVSNMRKIDTGMIHEE